MSNLLPLTANIKGDGNGLEQCRNFSKLKNDEFYFNRETTI